MNKTATHKRVNITLPDETIRLIEGVTDKGERSRFLDMAVRFYVHRKGKTNLRKLLREGATKQAPRDLALANEWFFVEEELWQKKPAK